MTLLHRSVALQGVGFGRRHVALQGLVRTDGGPTPWPGGLSGGGGSSSTPRRYLRPQHRRRLREELLFILKP